MSIFYLLLLFFSFFLCNPSPSTAQQQQEQSFSAFNISNSPWTPTQNRILVSSNNRTFAAGFRQLSTSQQLYIFAIWYRNITDRTIVWSLGRNSTFSPSSSLVITPSGALQLNDSTGKNLFPSVAVGKSNSPSLVLRDDGNLVFENWESFNFPTDTFLPNQSMNNNTLVSRNGKYIFNNSKDLIFNETDVYWSIKFQRLTSDGTLVKDNSASWMSADQGASHLRRFTLDDDGNLRVYSLDPSVNDTWRVVWKAVQEPCTIYGTCGPNSICMGSERNSPYCVCPPGFQNITGECKRKIPFTGPEDSKFLRLDYVNFSGGSNQTDRQALNFTVCESGCLANPSCLGFGYKFTGKQYCVHQLDRLLYGYWSPANEMAMFLRVVKTETDESNFTGMTTRIETICPVNITLPLPPDESNTTARNLAILITLFVIELSTGALFFWAFVKKYIKYRDMAHTLGLELLPLGGPKRFTYAELKDATKDFNDVIGHGGFGIVYKGVLPDQRVIAVKRLKNVGGGEAEFWAEVTIIARMHHLNLVRMWGFCAEKSHKMLVYEYVPNGSLAKFLFPNPSLVKSEDGNEGESVETRPILDWSVRYRIALGVARAIAYLHEECLEWVIHCDIKPENILLEDDFCPKVSDFGLAKLAKKEDKVTMSRIRGTRGYLAPEWVKNEPITAKADVYSFGMVLLEIVSGTRNFDFRRSSLQSEDWYFPCWAFEKVYQQKRVEDILDRQIMHCYDSRQHYDMVDRMVKTAMWCLQDRAELRPSMGKVAKMLEGTVEITEPGKPTIFYLGNENGHLGPEDPKVL